MSARLQYSLKLGNATIDGLEPPEQEIVALNYGVIDYTRAQLQRTFPDNHIQMVRFHIANSRRWMTVGHHRHTALMGLARKRRSCVASLQLFVRPLCTLKDAG